MTATTSTENPTADHVGGASPMDVFTLMRDFRPDYGNRTWTWLQEEQRLWQEERPRMLSALTSACAARRVGTVITHHGAVLGGHIALIAAKRVGLLYVPVSEAESATEEHAA